MRGQKAPAISAPIIFLSVLSISFALSFALSFTSLASEGTAYGFSLVSPESPEGWTITASGSRPSGSLEMSNQSARFSLFWERDPGIDPGVCLDKVAEAYQGDRISILEREFNSIYLNSSQLNLSQLPSSQAISPQLNLAESNSSQSNSSQQNLTQLNLTQLNSTQLNSSKADKADAPLAKVMCLTYAFEGCQSKRWVAAWKSEASDRLFMASMSLLDLDYNSLNKSNDTLNNNTLNKNSLDNNIDNITSRGDLLFSSLLKGFQDYGGKSQVLEPRQTIDDKWAVMLQDLLSSYHYSDSAMIPPSVLHIQVAHALSTSDSVYSLLSKENISIDRPEAVFLRPMAVQEILLENGYEARLLQHNGSISAAALGPDGRWQMISVNPSEPWRAIGALVSPEEIRGVVYDNLSDLAKDNAVQLGEVPGPGPGLRSGSYVLQDCSTSRQAQLMQPDEMNRSWMEGLQSVLSRHSYDEKYGKSRFDCSDVSQICWAILESNGYDARLMFSCEEDPLGAHMWVAVLYPYQEERYVAVEATVIDKNSNFIGLGKIALEEEYYKGIMYNTSLQFSRLHPEEGLGLIPQSAA